MTSKGSYLKWNNHCDTLASLLNSQLESGELVDVTIAAEGKLINVHHFVLCASSPYFQDLLSQSKKSATIILHDVKFSDIKLLVDYMYKGEVAVPGNQLESFIEAAKYLQIKGLTYKGNNPNQVLEPTVSVEMRTAPFNELMAHPDSTQQVAVSADLNQTEMLMEQGASDVFKRNKVIHPKPIIINLGDRPVEKERVPDDHESEMETSDENNNNQGCNSISNSSVDNDLLNSDSDEEERVKRNKLPTRRPHNKKNGKANSGLSRIINSQPFKCSDCGRAFSGKSILERHSKQGTCQSVTYFRCALCGRSINHKFNLMRHFSHLHKNIKSAQIDDYIIEVEPLNFTCSVCSCRCKDLPSLKKHKKQKHGGKSSRNLSLF